ncbi:precorrin-2 dehydrogenase/sirohydrochlorin ferrochelatase family protein [Desulfotomaculum sp. 1211_IL3151]|uniref:precorrin-2 dehydrogenase/sirohydrochlorin ferrochelatase family protein n=1 Tax=Desulfotomaculum sp. 1211_IL3151 TaxID=3084055 RepID=UPI002FDABD40
MTDLYPVFLNLQNRLCLVVGGGSVAERKISSLLACGARVRVVSPEVTPKIMEWYLEGRLELRQRVYQTIDLEGIFLVFAATNFSEVNNNIIRDCREKQLIVNVADNPQQSNFFIPSVVRRGKFAIAVSTSGASPLLAARVKRKLEQSFGPEYEEFMDILIEVRQQVLQDIEDIKLRQKIFKELVDSDILELLRGKKYDQVKERIRHAYCGYRS